MYTVAFRSSSNLENLLKVNQHSTALRMTHPKILIFHKYKLQLQRQNVAQDNFIEIAK